MILLMFQFMNCFSGFDDKDEIAAELAKIRIGQQIWQVKSNLKLENGGILKIKRQVIQKMKFIQKKNAV